MQSDSRPPPREAISAKASAVAPYNWINPGDLPSVLFVLKIALFVFLTRLYENYCDKEHSPRHVSPPPVEILTYFLILIGHGLYPA